MRRKVVRGIGLTTLLAAAALVLSGCWANTYNFSNGDRDITLTKDFSGRLIWSCTAEKGAGVSRALCVLDKINGVCFHIPEKGITQSDCTRLANYGHWEEMDRAIGQVIGADDCLTYYESKSNGNDDFWGSTQLGGLGCK